MRRLIEPRLRETLVRGLAVTVLVCASSGSAGCKREQDGRSDERARACEGAFDELVQRADDLSMHSQVCQSTEDCEPVKLPDRSLSTYEARHGKGDRFLRLHDPALEIARLDVMHHEPFVLRRAALGTRQLVQDVAEYRRRCDAAADIPLPYDLLIYCSSGHCASGLRPSVSDRRNDDFRPRVRPRPK
jgi:hypothetical protein